MKPTQRIERHTTAVEVARILRQRILGGHYKEGEFLRQEAIAQELGVSRIPVREALAILEAEGFAQREQYRGTVIPQLSLKEIEEIYKLRSMIEPYLLEQALLNITQETIDKVQELIESSKNCSDLNGWGELNFALHKTLYKPANMPLTMQILDQLLVRADRYLRMQRYLSTEILKESDGEHQHILDLIKDGRHKDAVDALRKHIAWNEDDVRQTYESALEGRY